MAKFHQKKNTKLCDVWFSFSYYLFFETKILRIDFCGLRITMFSFAKLEMKIHILNTKFQILVTIIASFLDPFLHMCNIINSLYVTMIP
jgi:hypothetical protein